ncbi:MAG: hypothetical protein LC644_10715 [Pseudonocardia sp.]|nr:hypothetical protein [Pseudonocardia sp.]
MPPDRSGPAGVATSRFLTPEQAAAGGEVDTRWVAERVAIEGLTGFNDDQAYRAMGFLLDTLPEIAAEVFSTVALLLKMMLTSCS